jgi:hypothetical protein
MSHTIKIDPETELVFTLSKSEATPRCMMKLTHGGGTDEHIAFKVCIIEEEGKHSA